MKLFTLNSKLFSSLLLFTLLVSLFTLTSCGTTRQVSIVERVKQDTIYINQLQYDSIFVSQDNFVDRSRDTIYIQNKSVEYRYRLLRDTLRIHQVDSIPVVKEVEVTKEVRYIPWWSKILNWIGGLSLLLLIAYAAYRLVKLYLKK